jgi:hypothetical protein
MSNPPIIYYGFTVFREFGKPEMESFYSKKDAEKTRKMCIEEGEICGAIDSFTLPAPIPQKKSNPRD